MKLRKITDKGKTGDFKVGNNEILIIDWNNYGSNPKFFLYDESRKLRQVDEKHFGLSVIGENYILIEEQLPLSIANYQITKDENGSLYCYYYQNEIIHGFDENGNKFLEWNVSEIGEGHTIYDIAYQFPDSLWLAFPTGQTITQVSISKMKEIYKIGGYT